jgi:hypothetical protein
MVSRGSELLKYFFGGGVEICFHACRLAKPCELHQLSSSVDRHDEPAEDRLSRRYFAVAAARPAAATSAS